jgi:uncharacterized protein (TIGR02596 family)
MEHSAKIPMVMMKSQAAYRSRQGQGFVPGFTLIELMIVVAVVALLLALVMPGLLGTLGASKLTQAGDRMVGFLSEAQSRAYGQGRPVEVRFYRVPSSEDSMLGAPAGGYFRGGLMLEYFQPGETDPRTGTAALARPLAVVRQAMVVMPEGTAMSENSQMSTLLGVATRPSGQNVAAAVETVMKTTRGYEPFLPLSEEYRSFVLYPETTSLDSESKWHLAVVPEADASRPPTEVSNYYTLLIDPVTTRLSIYRP